MPTKIEYCTSCGSRKIKVSGNRFYCPDCDVTYEVTDKGTEVVDTNPLREHKARLDRIEKDVSDLKSESKDQIINQLPVDDDNGDDEEEGFITWS